MLRRAYPGALPVEYAASSVPITTIEAQSSEHVNLAVNGGSLSDFIPQWAAKHGGVMIVALPLVGLCVFIAIVFLIKRCLAKKHIAVSSSPSQPGIVAVNGAGVKKVHFAETEKFSLKSNGHGKIVAKESSQAELVVEGGSVGSSGMFHKLKCICHSTMAYAKAWAHLAMHKCYALVCVLIMPWKLCMRLLRHCIHCIRGGGSVKVLVDETSNTIWQAKMKLVSSNIDATFKANSENMHDSLEGMMGSVQSESNALFLPLLQQARASGNDAYVGDLQRAYDMFNSPVKSY